MLQAARKQAKAIATIGVASALVVGGLAAAQDNSQGGQGSTSRPGPPMGPPPMGLQMKGLTYAELHVQRDGQAQVVRLDQGKIASVDAGSITLTENDGSSVTIPLDQNTKVMAGPGKDATVDDLSAGQLVVVCGPDGGTAKSVMVVPKPGQMKGGPQGGQLPPPPPGAPLGGGN
jgi:hypothetical protein